LSARRRLRWNLYVNIWSINGNVVIVPSAIVGRLLCIYAIQNFIIKKDIPATNYKYYKLMI